MVRSRLHDRRGRFERDPRSGLWVPRYAPRAPQYRHGFDGPRRLFPAGGGGGPPVHVASYVYSSGGIYENPTTVAATIAADDDLVVGVMGGSGGTVVTSCDDDLGNTYNALIASTNGARFFHCRVATGGSATVACHFAADSYYNQLVVGRYSGATASSAVEADQFFYDGSSGPYDIDYNIDTTFADDLLVLVLLGVTAGYGDYGLVTERSSFLLYDKTLSATGHQSFVLTTYNGGQMAAILLGLKGT